jgi:short subunit dehydrogenase-like uncharacterized protein
VSNASRHAWMLYGAYGTTGRMILDEALRRGHRPLLAGRDPSRLAALASESGLDSLALPLDSSETATPALGSVSEVLNAAGPYFRTGGPLRKLCLASAVSYVDVNGEIEDFQEALRCDAAARAKGVAVIPGAGFGVVFGEALAAHVARRLPDASWMRLSVAAANAGTSRGAALSTASVLAGGNYAIAGGRLSARPMAFRTWRVGPQSNGAPAARFGAAPCAEILAAHRLTGIGEIVAGVPMPLAGAIVLRVAGRLVGKLMSRRKTPERGEEPTQAGEDFGRQSRIWVEAGNPGGAQALSILETGEGYRMAATAAVRAIEEVIAVRPVGAMTPAQAFGSRFALSLPDTRIRDL